ncbi:hypothetical protein [Flavisolibacter ginsenosidimutans]|uniref:Polysaccharide chain length determinant N-terminal domain-containing protein n=1 Tax=Flavisolibacter ginsenosidimutans TaxID=661481 RepID=A0A5B8UMB4_9BACT|nr:hypothetical protein [Flavisolibacter ginsenosidimutans]QEC57329.1 hypothetical protein FSB75_15955 [Flavisolibacter ginsenosidimutans]
MEGSTEKYYSLGDVKRLAGAFLKKLVRRWWLLVLVVIAGAGLGAFYYQSIQKSKYEAVCTFILEEKQTSMGGLSSLASQFGFDLGGTGGGSLFAGDNIFDVIRSKKVLQKVLLMPLGNAAESPTLADAYMDFTGFRNRFRKNPALLNMHFSGKEETLSPVQDSVLGLIYESIIEKNLSVDRTNKKGSIVRIGVTAENSLFAKLLAERLVSEASSLYLTIKTGSAIANINQLQRRSDSLLSLLNRKAYTAAFSQSLDANPGLKTAAVPVEIATRDKAVIATIYTEVTKNLEASKLMLAQQTPVIQLLDKPGQTLKDQKKGLLYLLFVGGALAGFLFIFTEAARFVLANI